MTAVAYPSRTQPSHATVPSTTVSAHAATISTAVATLELAPPDVLTATSVTGRLSGGAEEPRLLTALSHELAERAGLVAEVRVEGDVFPVRLCRPPACPPESAQPSGGWLHRVLVGLLR